jgi:hypothetical protein
MFAKYYKKDEIMEDEMQGIWNKQIRDKKVLQNWDSIT